MGLRDAIIKEYTDLEDEWFGLVHVQNLDNERTEELCEKLEK